MSTISASFSGAQAIPDLTTITNSLTVAGVVTTATITAITVKVNLTHTWDSDLIISLIDPDTSSVVLFNRRGGSGDNLTNTVFSDAAALTLSAGSAPFSNTFKPEAALATIYAGLINGTWKLQISDVAGLDFGTLSAWTLSITYNDPPVFTSLGGGDTASIAIAENGVLVALLAATDSDLPAQTLTYSITGGEDAALFQIVSGNQLRFVTAPN